MAEIIETVINKKEYSDLAPAEEAKEAPIAEPTTKEVEQAIVFFKEGRLEELGWGKAARELSMPRYHVKHAYRVYKARLAETMPVVEENLITK